MPAAIAAAAITTAVSAGATYAFGSAVAIASYSAIGTFATTFAISAISGMLAKSGAQQSQPGFQAEARDRMQVVRSAVDTRRIVYGQTIVSGPLVFAETTSSDTLLHMVIPLAGHECQEIGDIYFDDVLVGTLDGSGNVTDGQFSGYARIKKHLGAFDQAADSDLVAESSGLWTTNHRLREIAYIYVRLTANATAFPNGIPNIKAVVKGKKLYDPRDASTAWSTNWALAVRDYLTSDYGLGCASSEIDDTAIIAAANIADESVNLGGSPSTSQVRYTVNGTVNLSDRPRDIMLQLLSAGAGTCVYTQGLYRVLAGAYQASTESINEDWLAGGISVRSTVTRQDLFNGVRGTFSDSSKGWQPTDFPLLTSVTYEGHDGGERILRDIELPFTTNSIAAQRIGKIHLLKSRQSAAVKMTCNLKAFSMRVWDTVTLSIDLLGWSNKVFVVTSWAFNERGQVDLELQEESSTSYDWDYGDIVVYLTAALSFSGTSKNARITLSDAGLTAVSDSAATWKSVLSTATAQSSGTYYCEFTINAIGTACMVGLGNASLTFTDGVYLGQDTNGIGFHSGTYPTGGNYYYNGIETSYSPAGYTTGDVIGMAYYAASQTVEFFRNGVSQGVVNPGLSPVTGSWAPAVSLFNGGSITANFGASAYSYTAPAGASNWVGSAVVGPADTTTHVEWPTSAAKTDGLNSATTVVDVASATAPSTGQVLTATDSTHATWVTPPADNHNDLAGLQGGNAAVGSPPAAEYYHLTSAEYAVLQAGASDIYYSAVHG